MIAENVRRRAEKVFPKAPNLPVAIRMATSDADSERMAKSNIQKVLAGKTSITLEQLDALARALEVTPYQLLIPSLDANNPQIAMGASKDEQTFYRSIAREAVKEALQQSIPPYKSSKTK